jgi:hypothetical protein
MRTDWREKAALLTKIRKALYDASALHGGVTLRTLASILSEPDHKKDPEKIYREMRGNLWWFSQPSGVWFLTKEGEEKEEELRKDLRTWSCARDIANLLVGGIAWIPGDFQFDHSRITVLEIEITERALERVQSTKDEIVARIAKQIGPLPEIDEVEEFNAEGVADTAIENAARKWLLARING